MQDFSFWFGLVANSITVLAGLIAIAGVVWALLGRARLEVMMQSIFPTVAPSMSLAISSVGSSPIRSLELSAGTLDNNGFSMMGDSLGVRAVLNRGESLSIMGYEVNEVSFGDEPRENEYRFGFGAGQGCYLNLQWQSPLFPWRRMSRTYAWPPARRFACEMPRELRGRRETRFLKRTSDPSLNSTLPGFVAPAYYRGQAVTATDMNFDDLVAGQRGALFIGFGATWQGKQWEDAKRVLAVFAAKYASRIKVLVVETDKCPTLAARFTTNEIPVFKVLFNQKVTKSYSGLHSMPDLEREFADFLS